MSKLGVKVALVTGASAGIGRATAHSFARSGYQVVLADVTAGAGEAAARAIEAETGATAVFIRCDVSSASEVSRLIQETVRRFGQLDCAFNNAGIEGTRAMTADCSEQNWDRTINVNLKGVWLCMKHEIQQMLKQGGGAIVNCSSIAGQIGFPEIPAYTASKHGVIGLTRTAAIEYATQGIRVNAICPGVIDTAMVERFTGGNAEVAHQLAAGAPIKRMGRPEEIADAVLWLCSEQASFVTGHSMVIDGGWIAQ